MKLVKSELGPGITSIDLLMKQLGMSRPVTLTAILERYKHPPVKEPPVVDQSPSISVTFSGSISAAAFTVTGSGFRPNLPGTSTEGVAIRVVDATVLIETRREHVSSDSLGNIRHVINGDISNLALNAAGVATIAFSATDGRRVPTTTDQTGFLWSNTVRINFP